MEDSTDGGWEGWSFLLLIFGCFWFFDERAWACRVSYFFPFSQIIWTSD